MNKRRAADIRAKLETIEARIRELLDAGDTQGAAEYVAAIVLKSKHAGAEARDLKTQATHATTLLVLLTSTHAPTDGAQS